MTADVVITKVNELYVRLLTDRGIAFELSDHFSYYVEGYKFMPKYKSGVWDGKIKLFNLQTKSIYSGLIPDVIKFCEKYNYTYEIADDVGPIDFSVDLKAFVKRIPEFCTLTPYDYQIEAFLGSIIENKSLILSPTGSGKSLIIYLIARFILEYTEENILLVVPTTSLVEQMVGDFRDYDPAKTFDQQCHKIYTGKDKLANVRLVCTTWQSIYKLPPQWFQRYGAVIIDEAHQADGASLTGIVNKMPHAKFRVGLTGTLDGTKTHELFMRGICGKIIRTTTTKKLMDSGKLAQLEVDVLRLKYQKDECKAVSKLKYRDEIAYLMQHETRNKLLVNLSLSQKNNTLLLFNFVEGHGEKLYERALKKADAAGKTVFLIHGSTPVEERERIRHLVETRDDIVIYASYGVFSAGINMKNLHVVIFGHPFKSRIRNLQSIGRGLRTSSGKLKALLVDICDDLIYNDKHNLALDHAIERLKIYESEQFKYRIQEINV